MMHTLIRILHLYLHAQRVQEHGRPRAGPVRPIVLHVSPLVLPMPPPLPKARRRRRRSTRSGAVHVHRNVVF